VDLQAVYAAAEIDMIICFSLRGDYDRENSIPNNDTLTYLHGDHLGSASLATDASGTKITDSDTCYYPYGATRPGLAGTGLPTDRRFTGQREEVSLGFYDYGARPYDPALGRFLQADTIVPDPANPQSLNRYSYTLGNPLRYTDPSGHIAETEIDDANAILEALGNYDVHIAIDWGWFLDGSGDNTIWQPGLWQLHELEIVLQAVKDFARVAGGVEATRRAIGGATIKRIRKGYTAHWGFGQITLADYTFNQSGLRKIFGPTIGIVHELAHYWDWKTGNLWAKTFNLPGQIVRNLPNDVGPTAYGRMNSTEGWAESVTGYIYPVYFAILRAEGSKVENDQQPLQYGPLTINFSLPGLTPRNRGYVEQQFQALAVAQ